MDRKYKERPGQKARPNVALRKESVDRKPLFLLSSLLLLMSLSARRAWIESQVFQRIAKPFRVALRKESVDRKTSFVSSTGTIGVALRKESVDRKGCNRKNWVVYL